MTRIFDIDALLDGISCEAKHGRKTPPCARTWCASAEVLLLVHQAYAHAFRRVSCSVHRVEARASLSTLRRATILFGGMRDFAALLDVPLDALAEWLRAEGVPPPRIVSLAEDIVGGRIRSLKVCRDRKTER